MKERLHRPIGSVVHRLIAAIAVVVGVTAWSQLDRLEPAWRWLLVLGSAAVVVGLIRLAQHRHRAAGLAFVVAAATLPTGFAFLLNAVLAVLALPLVLRPANPRPNRVT